MSEERDSDRGARLADLHARLEAGEFAGAFNMDSEPTAEQLGAESREEFRLYGYATRVDRDPAVDFDGFLDDLWTLVASRFQLVPEESDAGAGISPAGEVLGPSLRAWSEARGPGGGSAAGPADAAGSGRSRLSDAADRIDD